MKNVRVLNSRNKERQRALMETSQSAQKGSDQAAHFFTSTRNISHFQVRCFLVLKAQYIYMMEFVKG